MKIYIKFLMITALFVFTFSSCNNDEVEAEAPTISNTEFGHNNNKTAYVGADLHVEAVIKAPGKIDNIRVEIHPKSGIGWKYDEVFKEGFEGLLNATFHKHPPISATATPGEYHLHLIVTDKNGKQTAVEEHIEIVNDPTLPSISGFKVSLTNGGNTLHVEAHITAPNKIKEVEVEIEGAWEKEVEYTDAAMVGQTSYHFSKDIDIASAPAGHYHVHLGVTDQKGKNIEFEEHFNK